MKVKTVALVAGALACLFLLWAPPRLISAPGQPGQDDLQNADGGQIQDAGADTPSVEPDSPADTSQDIAGGGMVGPDYKLGPEDVITITVFQLPELTETVRVENDGTIFVKLLGPVPAAGMTLRQLRDELQVKWGKTYLEDPHVNIFIKQYHARPVSVVGAVAKPGLYQLPGSRTLLQLIAMAGGVNMPGTGTGNTVGAAPAGRWVYVTRKGGFADLKPMKGLDFIAKDQIKVDLGLLMYSHDLALDIPIKPFDTVTVSKAGIVYVLGAVNRPGGFTLEDRDSLTALQALALAEGFAPNPKKSKCEIIHRQPDGGRTEKIIDLGKVMKGKAKDPVLTANDILVVPDSTGRLIGKQGLAMGLGTLTGLVIWRGVL